MDIANFKKPKSLEEIKKGVQQVREGIINAGEFSIVYGNPFHIMNMLFGLLDDAQKQPSTLTITGADIEEIRQIVKEMDDSKSGSVLTETGRKMAEGYLRGTSK